MKKNRFLISVGLIILLYFLTHLLNLTSLPVFADEAIYLRWSQLIISDWQQYLFFALNDGKTPLQIWASVVPLLVFPNPLFAGRLIPVLAGFFQVVAVGWMVRELGGKKKAVLIGMLLTTVLPFWFFHHRVALLDGVMTLFLTLATIGVIKTQTSKTRRQIVTWVIFGGISFGLALWTKLTAILFIVTLPLFVFLKPLGSKKEFLLRSISIIVSIVIGGVLFSMLKLHPAFGQLFARGSDFLFPVSEVLLEGKWLQTIQNTPSYLFYFIAYLSSPLLLLVVSSLFFKKNQRVYLLLFFAMLSFVGPITVLGRVVYPRYLFPAIIFPTVIAALALERVLVLIQNQDSFRLKLAGSITLAYLSAHTLGVSGVFIYHNISDPDETPFVSADRTQYLTEWSSGHGLVETVEYIRTVAQSESVAVATEGSFGSLPDGLLLYFFGTNVDNIYIEGIGYPVEKLSPKFIENSEQFERKLLVVNSHRMNLNTENMELLVEYCRPYEAPCLQVWDITQDDSLFYPVPKTSDSL